MCSTHPRKRFCAQSSSEALRDVVGRAAGSCRPRPPGRVDALKRSNLAPGRTQGADHLQRAAQSLGERRFRGGIPAGGIPGGGG